MRFLLWVNLSFASRPHLPPPQRVLPSIKFNAPIRGVPVEDVRCERGRRCDAVLGVGVGSATCFA